jgi:hypothetical protein
MRWAVPVRPSPAAFNFAPAVCSIPCEHAAYPPISSPRSRLSTARAFRSAHFSVIPKNNDLSVLSPWSRPASGKLLGEPSGSPTPDEQRCPTPAQPRGMRRLMFGLPHMETRRLLSTGATGATNSTASCKQQGDWAMSLDAQDKAVSSSRRPIHAELSVRCGIQGIAHAFSGSTSIVGRGGRRDKFLGTWRRAVVGTNSPRLQSQCVRPRGRDAVTFVQPSAICSRPFSSNQNRTSQELWRSSIMRAPLWKIKSSIAHPDARDAASESHVRPARDQVMVNR